MTRERITELVDIRKEELTRPYEKDYRYDYCKKYLENNDISRIEDFIDVDIFEYMKCAYYLNGSKWSIEEIDDRFESFRFFLEISEIDNLHDFIQLTINIDAADNIDEIINYLKEKNIFKAALGVSGLIEEDRSYFKILKDIKKVDNCKDIDLANYFEFYKEQESNFLQLIVAYMAYRTMKSEAEYVANELDDLRLKEKEKSLLLKKVYRDNYDVSRLFKDVNRIRTFVDEEERKEKQFVRNNNKELFNIDTALELLDKGLSTDEVTNAREIVSKIKDLNIKYAVLELISEHNNKYYEKLNNELQHLNKNNKLKYQALLHDYGITNGLHDIERIMNNSLEDVESMLKIISKFNLSVDQTIKVLRNSDLKQVLQIKEFVDKGYLSLEFIIKNNDLFYKNSSKYQAYTNNLEVLYSYNINPSIFFESIGIMFMYSNLLKDNLEILNTYNLLNSLKTTSNYKFLTNNNLVLIIDRLIELGYESFLENDLNILNSDKLLRLEALKAFETHIDSKDELDKVLTKRFYIADEELEEFIPNKVELNNKVDLDSINLDEYRDGLRTYNINGTLVSINKVNRLLENGNSMYNALFSEMPLSIDEYNGIIKELTGSVYHK